MSASTSNSFEYSRNRIMDSRSSTSPSVVITTRGRGLLAANSGLGAAGHLGVIGGVASLWAVARYGLALMMRNPRPRNTPSVVLTALLLLAPCGETLP